MPASEVLVVGAGPVGLMMAGELARHGIRARVIDALATPSPYCRALGITPRTLEIWENMGVAREAIEAGLWLEGFRIEVEGQPPREVKNDLHDLPYSTLSLPQPQTERILARHLGRHGIEVERGVRLTGAKQHDGRVDVTLERAGAAEQATYRYVIGCDGAHSAIRHLAGIGFSGEAMPYDFMLGDVHADFGLPRGWSLRTLRPRKDAAPDMLVVMPLPETHRYRVSMFAPPGLASVGANDHGIQSERPAPSLEQLQAAVDLAVPGRARLSDPRWTSLFRVSMRLADHYRAGNLFLAGDAAHVHPPTGGQGMNTGIQDACNLAWKLALVLQGAAPAALLDSYELERRTEGADVIARTTRATLAIPNGKTPINPLVDAQILVAYAPSAWIRDDAGDGVEAAVPAPGQRAPDCTGLMRTRIGFPARLFDLLHGTGHVLLADVRESTADRLAALDRLADRLRVEFGASLAGRLRIVAIGGAAAAAPRGIVFASDDENSFERAYRGGSDGLAWLVRPDGHIGWRGRGDFGDALAGYLRAIFTA
ncbi:MAG: FAD-dependent monooxygenase [Verrucomicrobiota bacterium]